MMYYLISIFTVLSLNWASAQYYDAFPGKLFRITNVEFSSEDGFPLKGTIYSSVFSAPSIVLLPMMGIGQRFHYESLAVRLAIEGFHVLAVDLRGQGESVSDETFRYDSEAMTADQDAAINFLKSKTNCLDDQIGIIGASGTVAEAIATAGRHRQVRAIVGLSGHADSSGMIFISQPYAPPILGIGAASDSIMTRMSGSWQVQTTAETMQAVVSHSKHPDSQLIIYKSASHGTTMLDEKEELVPMIITWLQQVFD